MIIINEYTLSELTGKNMGYAMEVRKQLEIPFTQQNS